MGVCWEDDLLKRLPEFLISEGILFYVILNSGSNTLPNSRMKMAFLF